MTVRRSYLAWIALSALLAVPGSVERSTAQTAQTCLDGQSRYAGTICRGMAKCYVKAMKRGTSVDPDCIPGRKNALIARFNSVEAGDNCLTEPAGNTTANMLESGVGSLASTLGSSGECISKKMGALGRECKQMLMCYAASAAGSQPGVDSDCLDTAVEQVLEVFDKIEAHTACTVSGDGSSRSDDVDSLTNDIWTYLRGVGTTTTSTTTTIESTTTTTMPDSCPTDGAYTPCTAYSSNNACSTCVNGFNNDAKTLCTGAAAQGCTNASSNHACGFAINTATDCATTCCPP